MISLVQVSLSQEDANSFVEFRRHQEIFQKLLNARAFDIRNGSFVVHLDGAGNIRRIDRNDQLYTSS